MMLQFIMVSIRFYDCHYNLEIEYLIQVFSSNSHLTSQQLNFIMLKISSSNIKFLTREKVKNLTLTNELNEPIIYKVKTNNIDAIQAKPTCGFIKPNTSISLLVKALKQTAFEAKIQIIYSSIQNQGALDGIQSENSFQNYWGIIDKSAFKYLLVSVNKVYQQSAHHAGQFFFSQNTQQRETHMFETKDIVRSISHSGSKQRENNTAMQISDMRSIKNSNNRDSYQRNEFEKQFLIEKGRVAKLKQQLDIAQGKLRELTDSQIQTKINRTMALICQQHHTSFTTLVLIGLFCLVLGFILGKS